MHVLVNGVKRCAPLLPHVLLENTQTFIEDIYQRHTPTTHTLSCPPVGLSRHLHCLVGKFSSYMYNPNSIRIVAHLESWSVQSNFQPRPVTMYRDSVTSALKFR